MPNTVAIAEAEKKKSVKAEAKALAEKMAHEQKEELHLRADKVVDRQCDEAMRKNKNLEGMQVWRDLEGSACTVTIEVGAEVLHTDSKKTYVVVGPGKPSAKGESRISVKELKEDDDNPKKTQVLNRNLTVASHKNLTAKNLEKLMAAMNLKL